MGKRPQKRSRSQALCQFHALRWLQVEAGRQARWDSLGRLMAGWSCYLSLKQRAPNRKEEQQKPSPVCSSEKAPVRMRPHQPLWLLATAHLPLKQCRLHTAPWSMDSWKCLTKSPPKGSILIFFFFFLAIFIWSGLCELRKVESLFIKVFQDWLVSCGWRRLISHVQGAWAKYGLNRKKNLGNHK